MRPARRAALAMVAALALILSVAGCGSKEEDVRQFLSENYELVDDSGDFEQYHAEASADEVADAVSDEARPGRQHTDDDGEHYLGYRDLMLHISDDPDGGSDIESTDPRDGYDRWGLVIVPFWGTYGGSYRSAFSGGGSGFGK